MIFIDKNTIRTLFSRAMSEMYQKEVPQYSTLLELVEKVNRQTLESKPALLAQLKEANDLNRISEERHGAIRLGKAEELNTMRQLFAVMGMYPVGYYDLSIAGMPVHSTGFRPTDDNDLKRNPFRIFTSLLRTELIADKKIREMAEVILSSRDIFTKRVRELLVINKQQGGLTFEQGHEFVSEAIDTFRWHKEAIISHKNYDLLKKIHPLVADVVSFKGPHINHLTPRTLDITTVQNEMTSMGLNPKAIIEGPPEMDWPILLRQTSFKALEEPILFPTESGQLEKGTHRARFGEIEQRGAALTPKGHQLYEKLLSEVHSKILPRLDGSNGKEYYSILEQTFKDFPKTVEEMRRQKLIFLEYRLKENKSNHLKDYSDNQLDNLIRNGHIAYYPIVYEDFLPVSAAGIFTSNLGDLAPKITASSNKAAFEKALGTKVIDPFQLYRAKQENSLKTIFTYF